MPREFEKVVLTVELKNVHSPVPRARLVGTRKRKKLEHSNNLEELRGSELIVTATEQPFQMEKIFIKSDPPPRVGIRLFFTKNFNKAPMEFIHTVTFAEDGEEQAYQVDMGEIAFT